MRGAASILTSAILVFALAYFTTGETADALDRSTWTLLADGDPIPVLLQFVDGTEPSFSLTADCTDTVFRFESAESPHAITGVTERSEPNCLPVNVQTIAGYWSAASTVTFERESDRLDVQIEFEADAGLPVASLRFARVDS